MVKREIELRIATPLFMGGLTTIHRNKKVINTNLNSNSIKGVIRWWFRTLHGWDNQKLHKEESNLLGSIDSASSVKMRIESDILSSNEWNENDFPVNEMFGSYNITNSRTGRLIPVNYNGLKYLSYFNCVPDRREETVHRYYSVGQSFKLILIAKSDTITNILPIIWLWLQFGGSGYRSRRGFGKLEILNSFSFEEFQFKNKYNNIEDYSNTITKNIKLIRNKYQITGNNSIPFLGNSNLFTCFQEVNNDWKEALNLAGVTMQRYRNRMKPDYSTLRRRFSNPILLEKPIFGLPIRFKFTSVRKSGTINNYHEDNETRFSSPIIVSVTKINNKYYPQYLILNFDFNKLDARVNAIFNRANTQSANVSVDNMAVPNFIHHLKTFSVNSTNYNYDQIF